MTHYPLAKQGVFHTIQGEGCLLGTPMVFVRLAGCSIGCPQCDTDYTVDSRDSADGIVDRVKRESRGTQWVWVTGGEPTDHKVMELVHRLQENDFRVALATAGVRKIQEGRAWDGVDFLSVSPHSLENWVQRSGTQINVVPGLNGLFLEDWRSSLIEVQSTFAYRFVTPCYGDADSLRQCLDWVRQNPNWKLGVQAHKVWGVP